MIESRMLRARMSSSHAAGDQRAEPLRSDGNPFKSSTIIHWVLLVLSLAVAGASFILSVRNKEQVVIPVVDVALPGTCTFRRLTGVNCPGCGLTRSFISAAHGQWRASWNYNPVGILFFAVVVFQIPYRAFQIVRIRRGRDEHRWAVSDNWILISLAALLLIQWVIGLLTRFLLPL